MKKILIGSLLAAGMLSGQAMAFQTTATYGAPANEIVGPFDTYDFGTGALAIQPTGVDGSGNVLINGAFQSFVTDHELSTLPSNKTVPSNVETSGGYEITVIGNFTAVVDPSTNKFTVTSGGFSLYLDSFGDYDFTGTGTGFDDGTLLMEGTVFAGSGFYDPTSPGGGFGYASVLANITQTASGVYSPVPPGGVASFLLTGANIPGEATGVDGIPDPNNNLPAFLVGADGQLIFVPIPAAAFLLGPVLLGGLGLQRRRGKVDQLAA